MNCIILDTPEHIDSENIKNDSAKGGLAKGMQLIAGREDRLDL
jgi:hypothetical protein